MPPKSKIYRIKNNCIFLVFSLFIYSLIFPPKIICAKEMKSIEVELHDGTREILYEGSHALYVVK